MDFILAEDICKSYGDPIKKIKENIRKAEEVHKFWTGRFQVLKDTVLRPFFEGEPVPDPKALKRFTLFDDENTSP